MLQTVGKVLLVLFVNALLFALLAAAVLGFFEWRFRQRPWHRPHEAMNFDVSVVAIQKSREAAPTPEEVKAFTWDGNGESLAHKRSGNRKLVYELKPNVRLNEFISTNSSGFRDSEFSTDKPENTFRICVIGDSITFGWYIPPEEVYPEVLEQLLQQGAPEGVTFDVYNLGVGGYNAEQELEVMKQSLQWKPDLFIIGYCVNDELVGSDAGLWWHFSMGRFEVWNMLKLRAMEVLESLHTKSMFERSYEAMATLAKDNDVPVVAAFFPTVDPNVHTFGILRHIEIANAAGMHTLDLYDRFAQQPLGEIFLDDFHPNAAGHRMAAEELAHYLVQSQLIPSRQ